MPVEFQIDNKTEYIWAYQRFELFVDAHQKEIRDKLGNEQLTRKEMLDALCFGNFEKHKNHCITWEQEGKIPTWKK